MARVDVIRRDLLALGGEPTPLELPAVTDWLGRIAAGRPEAWVGVLYLFEGSRMGSRMLARSLARALGVRPEPGCGLDYHLDGAADRPTQFRRFQAALDALPMTDEGKAAAAEAAVATFRLMGEFYGPAVTSER